MIRVGDGPESIDLEAASVEEMMQALLLRFPDLQEHLDRGVAVSINGQIFRDDWTVSIPQDAEVYLIPRIEGG
jgi:molybdopterin converting factor small subunit